MNKTVASIVIAVSLVAGGVGGFLYGKGAAKGEAMKEVRAILDLAYPPPSENVKTASGVVREVGEGQMKITIDDPMDYLPHIDNSPRKKIDLAVKTTAATEYYLTDYTKFDENGNPKTMKIRLEDFKVGEKVALTADSSVTESGTVTAVKLEITRY